MYTKIILANIYIFFSCRKYFILFNDGLFFLICTLIFFNKQDWDRRTNRTYLEVLIKPELLQPSFNLGPNFKSPDPNKFDYEKYRKYIEENLPIEIPAMFGMHANAEIGYLTE